MNVLIVSKNAPDRGADAGRLIAVLSASGGTGASTLAANIATVLARDEGKSALIDLKPGRGDLASLLNLKPLYSIADLGSTRQTAFENMLVRHSSGVHLLGSAPMVQDIGRVTSAAVTDALRLARASFPNVVVDLEDCFHAEQVVVLRQANCILLTTRLDLTATSNCRRNLEQLRELDVEMARVRVIVSRHGQLSELPVNEAERALGREIAQFVPEDALTVNAANNAGIPVVLRAASTNVALAMIDVARSCLERRLEETLPGVPVS